MLQKAKSNNLFCTKCKCKVKKGDRVYLDFSNYGVLINVLCIDCHDVETDICPDDEHIFSSDALGQL